MSYELGRRPESLRVLLIPGEDFRSEIQLLDDGATFGGVPPELHLGGQVFQAELIEEGAVASFVIGAEAVASLSALDERAVRLVHQDQTLASGKYEVV